MTSQGESVEEQLLRHAARQTKALESINGILWFLLAATLLAALYGIAVAFNG